MEGTVCRQCAAGLARAADDTFHLPVSVSTRSSGLLAKEDSAAGRNSHAVWLSPHLCPVTPGRMGHQPQTRLPAVRAEGFHVRQKPPKRCVAVKARGERSDARAPTICWAMDFVHDQWFEGHRFKMLTVVDTYSKICPAIGVGTCYRGSDVFQVLEQASQKYGIPKCIRVDNGSEFVSRDLDFWTYSQEVQLDFSKPGKPTDNAFIEAFNSRFRQECLNQHGFLDMTEAKTTIEAWR